MLCLETRLLSHGTVRFGFCLWYSLESTQMTAVYVIQRHSCCEMLLFVWASNLEEIFHRVVFLRLLRVGVCWLLITRQSKLCVNSESHRFLSHLRWSCIQFLFASLNHNLAQTVPRLIHSTGLAEVFRYHPSSVFVHCITSLKKLFSSF